MPTQLIAFGLACMACFTCLAGAGEIDLARGWSRGHWMRRRLAVRGVGLVLCSGLIWAMAGYTWFL